VEVAELAPGVWRWTVGDDAGYYAELDRLTVVVDPPVPADEAEAGRFWRHLDADVERRGAPVAVLVSAERHLRAAEVVAARYAARVLGAEGVRGRLGAPDALEAIEPGTSPLPGVEVLTVEDAPPGDRLYWLPALGVLVAGDWAEPAVTREPGRSAAHVLAAHP
jgi:hypothetical protein